MFRATILVAYRMDLNPNVIESCFTVDACDIYSLEAAVKRRITNLAENTRDIVTAVSIVSLKLASVCIISNASPDEFEIIRKAVHG